MAVAETFEQVSQRVETKAQENPLVGVDARIKGDFTPTQVETTSRNYIAGLTREERLYLFNTNILILGAGNAGGNIAVELAMNGIGTGGRMIVVDPDTVERGNIASGQPYRREQADRRMSKAHALKAVLDEIRMLNTYLNFDGTPFNMPSDSFDYVFVKNLINGRKGETRAFPHVLRNDDLQSLFINPEGTDLYQRHGIDLVVDAIDISEPGAVYSAHKIAYEAGVPVVTAFDLMTGFKIMSFDKNAIKKQTPLMGLLKQEKIGVYERIRQRIKASGLPKDQQATSLKVASYDLLIDGLITASDFFPSLARELLSPTTEAGKTRQLPDTARAMGTRTAAEVADLLLGKNGYGLRQAVDGVSIVKYDLDREGDQGFYAIKKILATLAGALIINQVSRTSHKLSLQYS